MTIQYTIKGTISGREIKEYTITNKNKLRVSIMEYGAAITSAYTPNKSGEFHNIVLGFDQLGVYQEHLYHFDVTTGRVSAKKESGQKEF